ncbi:MAG: AraC family transcriptional regulator [Balneolaceae bacterium]
MDTTPKKREGFLGQKLLVIPDDIRNQVRKNPLISSLYITSIGHYPHAEHHFRERKKGSKQYIFLYCVEGFGYVIVNNKKYRLSPNVFFIIPPDTSHSYEADEKDPWSIYWFHFTGTRAELLYERYLNNNKKSRVVHIPFQEFRLNLFQHIINILEMGYSRYNIEYINITLWELLSSFIYPDFFQKIKHQNTEAGFMNEIITYMQNSIDQSISLGELADHINYSVSYFHTIFKEKTGFSPIHYFNQLKIQKACQYLSFTDLSIKEISHKLGFNDQFYFSRLFKKMMNLSPSEYRHLYNN